MSSFAIGRASVEDIPAIIGIQELTWFHTYDGIISSAQMDYMFDHFYSPDALRMQMADGHAFCLLRCTGDAGGFASYSASGNTDVYHLHKLYVLPRLQGTGAGRELLSFAEREIIAHGGKRLSLNVNRYNKAKVFYERMGYEVIREEDIPIGPYWMNDYVMQKTL